MKTVWSCRYRWMGFDLPPILLKIAVRIMAIGVFLLIISPLSGQAPLDMNTSGTLLSGINTEQNYLDWRIPNNPGTPYLFLTATGGDGGKREFKVISTCTKEGGQGAIASAWFKVGQDGLLPGGILRMIGGKKGENAGGDGDEGAGGGGGSGIVYLPPNVNQNDPRSWIILVAAGGGGGAAASTLCTGAAGLPGQASANGAKGTGASNGNGGSEGSGGGPGNHGCGGGGWQYPGHGGVLVTDLNACAREYSITYERTNVHKGSGWGGSGKALDEEDTKLWDYWNGGEGGPTFHNTDGYFNGGGRGFGGGGSGHGSGGGGGGYSGGGGGGLIGITGGGGGGGGSYVNAVYTLPFTTEIHQRSTTSDPKDGSIQYQFSATSPVAFRDLGFHYNKSAEASVLKTGEWTLRWQSDGNLVLYQSGAAKWASNTNTKGTDIYFQSDGNLVIRQSGNAIWASATANDQHGGKGGRKLVLTAEGHLFIVDQDGKTIWQGR